MSHCASHLSHCASRLSHCASRLSPLRLAPVLCASRFPWSLLAVCLVALSHSPGLSAHAACLTARTICLWVRGEAAVMKIMGDYPSKRPPMELTLSLVEKGLALTSEVWRDELILQVLKQTNRNRNR